MEKRPLFEIAKEVWKDWNGKVVCPHARPYLQAMTELTSLNDRYGTSRASSDSAKMIVGYFLDLSRGWKGEVARRIKAELRQRLKEDNDPEGCYVTPVSW